nr:hypothetical protein [uncultured Agathobaculum sp.]
MKGDRLQAQWHISLAGKEIKDVAAAVIIHNKIVGHHCYDTARRRNGVKIYK